MVRALCLTAVLTVGLTVPVFTASGILSTAAQAEEAKGPATQNLFTSDQARQHLMHMGYTNISTLEKDEGGKWYGTATKDGKTVAVAVDIKGAVSQK
jgi:hypothetical protein